LSPYEQAEEQDAEEQGDDDADRDEPSKPQRTRFCGFGPATEFRFFSHWLV
jgi:hypothetical protein